MTGKFCTGPWPASPTWSLASTRQASSAFDVVTSAEGWPTHPEGRKNTFITMTFLIQINFPFLFREIWSSFGKSQLSLAFLYWIFLNMAYLISPNCLQESTYYLADLIKLRIKFGYPSNQLRDRRTKRWWYEYYHNVKMLKDLFRTSQ